MSDKERTGFRSKEYSAWHRTESIKRLLDGDAIIASRLSMINIDSIYIEAKHPYDRLPAALVETAEVSTRLGKLDAYPKGVRILYQLGKAANVPVFLILYKCHKRPNPADTSVRDIEEFYVKEVYPFKDERWKVFTPDAFAKFLLAIRSDHIRIKRNSSQLPLIPNDLCQLLTDDDLERRWYSATIMRP
jgi:hypothetical protein